MAAASDDELVIWDKSAGATYRIQKASLLGGELTGLGTVATGGYTLTVPATGTAALRGVAQAFTAAQTFDGDINVRPHAAAEAWSVDIADGIAAEVPDTYVYQFSIDKTFAGMIMVSNDEDGEIGLFLCAMNVVVLVAQTGTKYSNTSGTSGKSNLYPDGAGEYRLKNETGAARNYRLFSIRMRANP